MIGTAKIFTKELHGLFYRPYIALWLVFVSLCFLYVAGSSHTNPPSIRIVVQQVLEATPESDKVRYLLEEYSEIEIVQWQAGWSASPIGLDTARASIGVFWDDGWQVLVRARNTKERSRLIGMANRVSIAISLEEPIEYRLIDYFLKVDDSPLPDFDFRKIPILDFGVAQGQNDISLVPGMIALIVAFLPFLMAVSTIVRDRENNSLSALLVAPRVGWWSLVFGKTLSCLFVAITIFFLLIIATVAFFNIPLHNGFLGAFGIQFLSITISTLLGLTASAVVRSQFQAYLLSAAYAFCLVFLTGLLFPLENAAEPVRFASKFFPLTFSYEPLQQAMLIGLTIWPFKNEIWWLIGQCSVAAILAVYSLTIARNRL